MTIKANARPLFAGAGKAKRVAALAQVASLSFVESLSRADSIANIRVALGSNPSEEETRAIRIEWQIGRVASRLAASDLPKDCKTPDARLAHARALVLHYVAPPKQGAKARKLAVGKLGYRTESQHRAIRAADEAWSQVIAELGIGKAKTQKEKNDEKATKAKRAPHHNKPTVGNVTVQELSPAKPMDGEAFASHVVMQLTSLRAYCDKHAKIAPIEMTEAIGELKALAVKAGKALDAHQARITA